MFLHPILRAIPADARKVGLDLVALEAELRGGKPHQRVKADFMSGVRSGVNGTPTFFIDEVRFDDSWDADTLAAALRAAIRAKTLAATG